MDDERLWSFEESLWTQGPDNYREKVDAEVVMVLPRPPFVLTGDAAVAAVADTPVWDSAELTELYVHQLEVGVAVMVPVNELIARLSPTDPSYQTRMDGLAQLKTGLSNMIYGVLVTFAENNAYDQTDLARMAVRLKTTLPALLRELPDEVRTEARARLKKLSLEAGNQPALRGALQLLLKVTTA